jgi:DNA-binding response OmpR family regulator
MTSRTVLVVEDDAAIRRGIVDALGFSGYATLQAGQGQDGARLATTATVDLVLLDLVLPGLGGFEILRLIREQRPTLPVIILTARGEEADRVQGLRLGADDYVVKPFSVRELLARVEAVLRRSPERPQSLHQVPFPDGVADLDRREVRYTEGGRAELSEREVELLRYLATHPGRVISRDEILQRLWRLDPRQVETRTIDVHIGNLRAKLRDTGASPRVVLTVRGKGYMLALPSTP